MNIPKFPQDFRQRVSGFSIDDIHINNAIDEMVNFLKENPEAQWATWENNEVIIFGLKKDNGTIYVYITKHCYCAIVENEIEDTATEEENV